MDATTPAALYRSILAFLASNPPPVAQGRLRTLLARGQACHLTRAEQADLDEYERIEHLIVMLKAGIPPDLTTAP